MRAGTILASLMLVCGVAGAQQKHTTANYDLAARFSAKNMNQMVFSTRIQPNWFAQGNRFWYSWKDSNGTRYYVVDPSKGSKTEIFDMEKLAMQLTEIVKDPFDAQHIPMRELKLKDDKVFTFDIVSSQDKPDTSKVKKGKPEKKVFHFEYDFASKTLSDVSASITDNMVKLRRYPRWASVSPDGTKAVFAKGNNLFWMDSTSLRKAMLDDKDTTIVEHRLTSDGVRDYGFGYDSYKGNTSTDTTKRKGVSELVWAPDSKHFVTIRWDMRPLKEFWVINSVTKPRPELETYKYHMPGEAGPEGDMFIFNIADSSRRSVKMHAWKNQDVSLLHARRTAADNYKDWYDRSWLGNENGFYMIRQSRDMKRVDLCWVGLDADSTKTIISERFNSYVETRNPYFIKDGKELLWWSERNGWANIYRYSADGTLLGKVTDGAFHVEDVLGVNEKAGYVVLSACGVARNENPYQMHTFKVPLAGGSLTQIDMPDMDVLSTASDDASFVVANYSRVDFKPAVALYNTVSGKKVMDLEEADFSRLFAAGYKFPERFKVKAADGVTDLYGAMYKPFDFDSTKVYPVCDYVYPGPQVEANNISWSRGLTRTDRLAQIGFIVITVGNRGGHPNRSKWYHNYGYGNLRDYGLEDQKYAIQQLCAQHPYMDVNRVGIHGHSGGGFMSTAAILTYPDFFKAAVSCSGNHDNSIYNRWWSETHHGVLEKVDKGDTTFVYNIHTNQELARNLKGHLMLWTGDIDDNVHPANTIRVMDALIRANKRFDFMMLPGQRHGYGDMNEYFFWKMADYYAEWLLGDSQRATVDITQMNND